MAEHAPTACAGCKEPVPEGANFCPRCATPVPGASGGGDAAPTQAPPPRRTPSLAPGTVIDGRYEVLARLGAGGFGEVYRVRHRVLEREMALKSLHPTLAVDEGIRRRFLREARVLIGLDHPHIVRLYDAGEWGDLLFMVMDFCAGQTLSAQIKERTRLSGVEAAGVMVPILRALDHAHRKGIVHRDLKPDNVMLVPDEGGRIDVKLLDFGVAKILEEAGMAGDTGHTATGAAVGTLAYMSPEQVQGQAIDGRTDVYAAGVVLYQMVTGKRPFDGENASQLLTKILLDPPAPFAAAGIPDDPPGMEALVLRCLAKEAKERPETAGEMADALDRLRRAAKRKSGPVAAPAKEKSGPVAAPAKGKSGPVPAPTQVRGGAPTVTEASPAGRRLSPPVLWGGGAAAAVLVFALAWALLAGDRPVRLTFRAEPEGTGSVSPAGGEFAVGTVLSVEATARPGYRFVDWSDREVENPRRIRIPAKGNPPVARFEALRWRLVARAQPPEGGTVIPAPAAESYAHGLEVTLTARPATGWRWRRWTDDPEAGETRRVKVEADRTLTAEFAPTYAIAVAARPPEAGTVEVAPAQPWYEPDTEVTATARAKAGWRFRGWEDTGDKDPLRRVRLTRNETWVAVFSPLRYTVTAKADPRGGGTVAVSPDAPEFEPGAKLSLQAEANPGWRFVGWRDGATEPRRAVTVSDDLEFTAAFVWDRDTLARHGFSFIGLSAAGREEYRHARTGIEFVLVPGGEFGMGSPPDEAGREDDEGLRRVRIGHPFLIAKYEVSNAEFRGAPRFKGHDSGRWLDQDLNGDAQPAVNVSWEDAQAYCAWAGLRLPTGAEWEWAARAGGDARPFVWGDAWPPAPNAGNFADEAAEKAFPGVKGLPGFRDGHAATAPVRSFAANGFGLHQMAGNVWEWCADDAAPDGEAGAPMRIVRGGSWFSDRRDHLRCAERGRAAPGEKAADVGFRPVADLGS